MVYKTHMVSASLDAFNSAADRLGLMKTARSTLKWTKAFVLKSGAEQHGNPLLPLRFNYTGNDGQYNQARKSLWTHSDQDECHKIHSIYMLSDLHICKTSWGKKNTLKTEKVYKFARYKMNIQNHCIIMYWNKVKKASKLSEKINLFMIALKSKTFELFIRKCMKNWKLTKVC